MLLIRDVFMHVCIVSTTCNDASIENVFGKLCWCRGLRRKNARGDARRMLHESYEVLNYTSDIGARGVQGAIGELARGVHARGVQARGVQAR
jgi:hypothetical protein